MLGETTPPLLLMQQWEDILTKNGEACDQSQSAEDWKKYVLSCVAYFCSPEFESSGKHWFCGDESTRKRAISSLVVLSFEDNPQTKQYQDLYRGKMATMLDSCVECAIKYQISSPELMESLITKSKIEPKVVEEFYRSMERNDKLRLGEKLLSNPNDLTAATEALWCSSCLASSKFINEHFSDAGPLTGTDARAKAQEFPANPGFLLFKFVNSPVLRFSTLHSIVSSDEESQRYIDAWLTAPRLFTNAMVKGLRRNAQAVELADQAWFTAGTLLKALGTNRTVGDAIATAATTEMINAAGTPKFGAHYFVYALLKYYRGRPEAQQNSHKLEELLKYVTSNDKLSYPEPLPKQLTEPMVSSLYRELDARIVLEWFNYYLKADNHPSGSILKEKVMFVLGLKLASFKNEDGYKRAMVSGLEAVSLDPDLLFAPILSEYKTRIVDVYEILSPDLVYSLWKYQQDHSENWLSLWLDIVRDPRFITKSLAQKRNIGFIVGILEGSRKIGIKWQVPTKQVAARLSMEKSLINSPEEEVIIALFEQLCDADNTDMLRMLIDRKRVLRNVFMLAISGNRSLSLSAEEFLRQSLGEDSFEASLSKLVNSKPVVLLSAIGSILEEAAAASSTWLAAMPGLIKLLLKTLDQIYDVSDGIDTTSEPEITKGLQMFWLKSWEVIANVIKQIKEWAMSYPTSYLKPILINMLDFSKGLLSKFRLIEADLTESLQDEQNWGAVLATPVIGSVTNMSALLQLALPDLLTMAFEIMLEILGLMSSFKVSAPSSLLALLEGLATRKTRSKLSKEELKVLLVAVGLTEDETNQVVDQQITGIVLKPNSASPVRQQSPMSSDSPTQSYQSIGRSQGNSQKADQQRSIGDFFKTSTGNKLVLPPRKIVNNQVLPNAPPQMSTLSQIRAQIHENKTGGRPMSHIGPIHPERPPGFNQPKPIARLDSETEEKDDEEDDIGALGALGAEKKREEAHRKLKEAFEQSKSSKVSTLAPLPALGKMGPSKQLLEEQKAREERAMKARLSAQPTELHRVMLKWDYFSSSALISPKGAIPERFDNVTQYQTVLSPLLYLEAWEGIQKCKEESAKCPPKLFQLVFGKRIKVDGFIDVYVSAKKAQFVEAGLGECKYLLLTYDKGTAEEEILPNQKLPHFLARIKEGTVKNTNNAKKHHVDFQIRLNVDPSILNKLHNGSTVNGVSLGVFTTVEREFTALMALEHYSLVNDILKASPSISTDNYKNIVSLESKLGLNRSQATAVSRATRNQGFSLIQGPPGTGKTKTILGIVGAFFSNNDMNTQATGDTIDENKKILICAPSNAAVDEIVLRLKGGVKDIYGKQQKINVLRLGRLDAVSEQVHDVTLEAVMGKVLDEIAEAPDSRIREEHTVLTMKRNDIKDKIRQLESSDEQTPDVLNRLYNEVRQLNSQLRDKNLLLDSQRQRLEAARRQRDANYQKRQSEIVAKSQVICTTLSGSAHPLLVSLNTSFESVIIDEAAQSIELSSLIPLKYGARKCVMVGDPNQLPPTVLSKEAGRLKYEQSLFVRMYNQYKDTQGAVSMLDTQFRMHPSISQFPSAEFYSNKLLDAPDLDQTTKRPWHAGSSALGPYTFFNVKGAHEKFNGHSLRNQAEASSALALVKHIHRNYPDVKSIGVISPYKEQVRLLEQTFVQSMGANVTSFVDFNSIDGFQGQEKDIIVMSCVRAADAKTNHIGFLGDVRRMNVALTRAKSSLWILGNVESLIVNPVWKRLIDDASNRNCLVQSGRDILTAIKQFDQMARKKSYLATEVTATTNRDKPPILEQKSEINTDDNSGSMVELDHSSESERITPPTNTLREKIRKRTPEELDCETESDQAQSRTKDSSSSPQPPTKYRRQDSRKPFKPVPNTDTPLEEDNYPVCVGVDTKSNNACDNPILRPPPPSRKNKKGKPNIFIQSNRRRRP